MGYYSPLSIIGSIIGFALLLYFFLPVFIFLIVFLLIYSLIMSLLGKSSVTFRVVRPHDRSRSQDRTQSTKSSKPLEGEIIETTLKKD